ncbi:MAG: complex I NDUFA9 subunit family protein [Herminiimonas sp.]|nr:complex I NDUFA9 subunit family protein [Herminiimonas sp.]
MRYSSILVIGGTGFIGSHLVAQLAASGRRVIVPTRHVSRSRMFSVLPKVEVVEANVHDAAVLSKLMRGVDAVINLVGILHSGRGPAGSKYGPAFATAHVELPKKIVAACLANGVQRYLHMSALGALPQGASMYLRSKADGEAAAFAPGLQTTVFRPSVVFGPEDKFLNLFATLQKFFPVMPLGGADARFQPVFVGDVARAFVNALEHPATFGKTYELAGPKIYTLKELVELAGAMGGHPRPVLALPPPLARLQALMLEWMPGGPLMSRDNLDSMKQDNIASGPIAPELGITPTALEAVAPQYLGRKI